MRPDAPHEILTDEVNQIRLRRTADNQAELDPQLAQVVGAYTATEYLKNPQGYTPLPQITSMGCPPWIHMEWVLGCPNPHTGLDDHATRRFLQTACVLPLPMPDGNYKTFKVLGPVCFDEYEDAADMAAALSLGRISRLAAEEPR